MKRHDRLSLRNPEATSQARAAGCNFVVVNRFQQQLKEIMAVKKFPAHRIFNGDEISTPTVLSPRKFVAERGVKQMSFFLLFQNFCIAKLTFNFVFQGNANYFC
jgi:hypothetical protein